MALRPDLPGAAHTSRSSSSSAATSKPVAPSLANRAPMNAADRSSSRVASEPGRRSAVPLAAATPSASTRLAT